MQFQIKQTPLHLAAESGQLQVATTLLQLKADVNALDNVRKNFRFRLREIFGGFLEDFWKTFETNELFSLTFFHFLSFLFSIFRRQLAQTPLHLAAQNDHPDVLKLFLQHKPELVSVPNKNGQTCAHIAAEKGSVAVLKELMKFNVETVKTARIKVWTGI